MPDDTDPKPHLLYCRCAWANVVPEETKVAVLEGLCASGRSFEAVADLCEMAAQRDPRLAALAARAEDGEQELRIAACYPRAVLGLFHQAGADLPEDGVEILNMREDEPQTVIDRLLEE